MLLTETRLAGYQPRSLWHPAVFVSSVRTPRLTHHSVSRYSAGTSSCGTSCVRASTSSASSASSTPITTSASNAFPSSSNSSTLSESAHSTLDNPCKSPDSSLSVAPSSSNSSSATTSTLWLIHCTCLLWTLVLFSPVVFCPSNLASAFWGVVFFFGNLLLAGFVFLPLFIGCVNDCGGQRTCGQTNPRDDSRPVRLKLISSNPLLLGQCF